MDCSDKHNASCIVSLFTREWIEIIFALTYVIVNNLSPSSRGSGLKYHTTDDLQELDRSPSSRGSGLKLCSEREVAAFIDVSLFTREWIEILRITTSHVLPCVSLFTREWIEIS